MQIVEEKHPPTTLCRLGFNQRLDSSGPLTAVGAFNFFHVDVIRRYRLVNNAGFHASSCHIFIPSLWIQERLPTCTYIFGRGTIFSATIVQ